MMRRIVTILICVLLLFSNCVFAAHTSFDTLSALNAMPSEFSSEKGEQAVTREEFAYIVSRIIADEEKTPKDTRFNDVSSANSYSGYIEFLADAGIISGESGSAFNPKGALNVHMACKMLVCVFGLEDIAVKNGGYPYGYYDIANNFGLLKGVAVAADGTLSQNDVAKLVENALFAEPGEIYMKLNDGSILQLENEMLLYKTFGVRIYNGTITEVFQDKCAAMFTATSQKKKVFDEEIKIGVNTYVDADSSIDLNKWENVPVTVWINSENKIIYAYPQAGIEVRYEYIDSVNGDIRDGALYNIGAVSRLTMRYDDDEYDVASNTQLKYNNKMTVSAVPLVGNYAKVVLENDEVFYIESWEMEEGGIITSASAFEIAYTKGRTENFKIKEIDKFENKKIFIDGRSADISELKTDSVFFYNISGDSIAITATEKVIVDVFDSYNAGEIKIGNASYKYRNVYYSEDGVSFKEDKNFTVLLGGNVKAYLAPDGYILYLKPEQENTSGVNKFYGVVTGVLIDNLDDKKAQIRMFRVDGNSPEEVIYEVDDKTVYYDEINLKTIKENAKNLDGKCVYYFELNYSGKIKSIRTPYDFEGFEGTSSITSSFANGEAQIKAANGKNVFFEDKKITVIYEKNGEFKVGMYSWSTFNQRDPVNVVYVNFYGNGEIASLPTMILMTGDFKGVGNKTLYHGIVTDISDGINAEGEPCKNVTFVEKSTKTYQLDPLEVNDLKLYDMVAFYDGQLFSDCEIYKTGTHIHLPNVINSWKDKSPLKVGYVNFIDSRMIRLQNGEAYYFNKTVNYFAEMEERPNGEYKVSAISYTDIMPGDRVIYVAATDGTRAIIKITD